MKQHVQAILEKPMNRKEFLGYIGAALLAVVGVSGMIKALLHHDGGSSNRSVAEGYGAAAYGGTEKPLFS